MARYFLLSLVFALISTVTFAQTSLAGKITDGDTGEELIAANVTLYKGGVLITGVTTDFEGNYSINVDPGTYDVEVSYVGYSATRTDGVIVRAGQTNKLDVALGTGVNMDEIVVVDYKVPLVEQDNTTQGAIVTSEDIRKFASKNITSVAASTAGMSQVDEGDGLTVRGSRSNATDVYVDGIRVRASSVQEADVEQLQVITGGIPAFYGDVTGGIISITTKGPSAKFSGGVEVETSEFLDDYGYNQVRANVSGPILKKKDTGESIIGFRFSGAYTSRLDDDPTAIGVYVVNDEKRAELEANPADGVIPTAQLLTNDDVDVLNYRPDEESSNLNITGKIDARLSKNIDISLTGAYVDDKDKFTPGGARDTWRLLNSHNNPTDYTKRYRGNFRFRHKLGGNNSVAAEAGAEQKSSLIQNAQYTLQFGFERENGTDYDPRHEDRFFDYGHYGTYAFEGDPEFDFTPIIDLSDPNNPILLDSFTHIGYETTNNTSFSSEGSRNPVLAAYNGTGDLTGSDLPLIANGIMNEQLEDVWAGLHTNIGQVYNRYNVNESDIITANANFSFDLLPGGSEEGRHSIQVGLLFEQRFSRSYTLNPERLWEIGQQSANSHILGLNTADILRIDSIGGVFDPSITQGYPVYNTLISDESELVGSRFYKEVRNTGIQSINSDLSGLHAYVNINSLDPSELSLDMFAPNEIADFAGMTGYYGYDYLGNKLDNSVTFEDFFTAKDPDGARSFLVPSFQPNYFAFFVQDKFSYKDIIFRIGLRVDRYDANTKVLKDPYSLYEVSTVADIQGLEAPGNVESDFKVYVESDGSPTVKAYRDGDQWYTAEGTAVNDGTLIFGNGAVFPSLKSPDEDIKDDNYRIANSFEDYKPQINVMPRLAFSFPISDAANFFAHYDILVQRPPSNAIVSPLQYYYFYDRTPPENNGNLKPERTIDYEVGFQQKLSNSSAIKIAAYYKEMRDMIQLRNFTQVASVATEYLAFDNLDFGTVKGFSFQYDLRRTGNISANVNYTLQFADGTGSDPESARDLAQRGRIRNIYPLNFDERHRIVGSVDYRYDSGKGYNGPRWFGKDVFASAGVNLQAIAVSGRPYTATTTPQNFGGNGTVGSINGARQPWSFTLNLRADKNFTLSKPGAKRPLSLNVYVRVQNLLDARNIVNVYSASGSPTDDGFLVSQLGQDQLNDFSPDERAFYQDSYSWTVQNPNNYTQPRRIFMGAIFDF